MKKLISNGLGFTSLLILVAIILGLTLGSTFAQSNRLPRRDNTLGRDRDEYELQVPRKSQRHTYRNKKFTSKAIQQNVNGVVANGFYIAVPVGTSLSRLELQNTQVQFNYSYNNSSLSRTYIGNALSANQQKPYWNGLFGLEAGFMRGPFASAFLEFGQADKVYSQGAEFTVGFNYRLKDQRWMLGFSLSDELKHSSYTLPETISNQPGGVVIFSQNLPYNSKANGDANTIYARVTDLTNVVKLQFEIRHFIFYEPNSGPYWWRLSVGYLLATCSQLGMEIQGGANRFDVPYNSTDLQFIPLAGAVDRTFQYSGPYIRLDFSLGSLLFRKR